MSSFFNRFFFIELERRLFVTTEPHKIELDTQRETCVKLRAELNMRTRQSENLTRTLEKTSSFYQEKVAQHVRESLKNKF